MKYPIYLNDFIAQIDVYKRQVFEQHFLAGGYATNFKRHGYEFDVSLHGIGGLQPGGNVYSILQACHVLDLSLIHI